MLLSFPVSRSWFKWCLDQRNVPPCSLKPRLCKPYMSLLFWTSSDVLMFCNKLSLLSSVKIFLYIPTSLLFMGSRQDSKLPILLSPHSSSHWALFVPAERSCYNAECCNNVTSFCVFHGNSELSSPFASRFFLQDNQFRLQYVFSSFYDGGGWVTHIFKTDELNALLNSVVLFMISKTSKILWRTVRAINKLEKIQLA